MSDEKIKYESVHPEYSDSEYEWRQMRDTVAGSSAVKRSGELYLPIPQAMLTAQKTPSSTSNTNGGNASDKYLSSKAPWQHSNRFYSDYLHRARFPDITSLTLRALLGIATRKAPVIELPTGLEYLLKKATPTGMGLKTLFNYIVAELLTVGRISILVDVKADGEFILIPYVAESYANWKTEYFDGEEYLKLAVLKEISDDEDEFTHSTEYGEYIVLRVEEYDGVLKYSSMKYSDGIPEGTGKVFPSKSGKQINRIPLFTANATRNGNKVGMAPMLGISDVAISIYQKDADMSQSEYMTCNPWLVFIGIDEDDAPKAVGSSLAFVIESKEGDAKYVEPTGGSLTHMQNRINDLFEEGLKYGVALLSTGGSNESTETVELRQESQGATLRTIVKNAERVIIDALTLAANWGGINGEIKFEANTVFSEHKISPAEMKELLNALVEGTISYETYFENLKKGGVFSDDADKDSEIDKISTDAPRFSSGD